jgi:ATP-dependent DNA helicase RecG
MKPSLNKLQKFFKLEAERGYDNHAVLGGLERILDRWEAEARADHVEEDLIQVVVERLRDYPRLATASRAEVLEGLLRRIHRIEEEPETTTLSPLNPAPVETKASAPTPTPEPTQDTAQLEEELIEGGETDPENSVEEIQRPTEEALPPAGEPVGHPAAEIQTEPAALDAPVDVLPGIGKRHAMTLANLGLNTLRDMLYYFPRRYDDYSQLKPINRLKPGEEVTVIATINHISIRNIKGGKSQIVEAVVSDGSGALRVNWFNQAWIAKRFRPGTQIVLAGKIEQYLGRLVMNNPEPELLEQQQLGTNRIVPVYPLSAQITQRWLRRTQNQVVTYWAPRVADPLPEEIRRAANLMDLPTALLQAHFPDTMDALDAARHRLAFDEIFLLQLGVLRQKRAWQERTARVFEVQDTWLQSQLSRLPFPLTGAQRRAVEDMRRDLASGRPMNRLLQGDVGSGKTIVAALGIAMVAHHEAQAALMAPTSILAEQHYTNLLKILASDAPLQMAQAVAEQIVEEGGAGPDTSDAASSPDVRQEESWSDQVEPPLKPSEIRLMIGATPELEKREIRAGLSDGSIKIVIGTHALIEESVDFHDLQLTIIDEQHRFGVDQRAALRAKGSNPHLMVMTATPIPRSLALSLYGDLDLTIMDEMPPGRQVVGTYVLPPRERERAYSLIRSQVEKGRQVYIIYPLVEESEKSDSRAAVEEQARLQNEIFPRIKVGLLHGRMKPEEKDRVMAQFRDGLYDILVSTTVIEVGVDVPNATVMLIEGANRFGLAQLHQLRGRVGRGPEKSYCLLIPETPDALENERLQVMTETNDGFVLAEHDLEQRGPGQFLGTRQAGFSELQLASLTDVRLIEKARRHAEAFFEGHPDLDQPDLQLLTAALERFWGAGKGDIS